MATDWRLRREVRCRACGNIWVTYATVTPRCKCKSAEVTDDQSEAFAALRAEQLMRNVGDVWRPARGRPPKR